MTESTQVSHITDAASRPSIIEHFGIDGLFGNKSVSLSSNYAATVLIARNGSGKTTLIAALDAFLRFQFTRFANLQFERITCKLRDLSEELVLTRSDIDDLINFASNSELLTKAKTWEIDPRDLLDLIDSELLGRGYSELVNDATFNTIYEKNGYDFGVALNNCKSLQELMLQELGKIADLRGKLKAALKNTDIVYLPTYRRIELSLPEPKPRRRGGGKSILSKLGVTRIGLHAADINFGLGDISEKLRSIYSEMLYRSNQRYGKISANVINDLISGDYRKNPESRSTPPSKDSLKIFFERIEDAGREYGRTPYGSFFTIPDLDRVYSDNVPEDAKPFLNYFLEQLNLVMQETRETEELVEAFIASCNRYLSDNDDSTEKYGYDDCDNFDSKCLHFNRKKFEVKVTASATGAEVPLESLSSGEKQMISLFARLYLYRRKKIILIDEPELSLSLDWQRQILPDIITAPTCQQIIAITHSPFIFDNELEPFAGSLNIKIKKQESKTIDINFNQNTFEGDENE